MFQINDKKKEKFHYKKVTRIGVYGVIVQNSDILLIKKRSGIYKGLLDLPGGGIEFGETTEETLRRELKEEVSLTFEAMKWIDNLSHVQKGFKNAKPFLFHQLGQIYQIIGEKKIDDCQPEEEFDWFTINHLSSPSLTPFANQAVYFIRKQLLKG